MNLLRGKIYYQKNYVLLLGFWIITQALILFLNGINVGGESERIIREANNLLHIGHFSSSAFYMYFTEIFLVYLLHLKLCLHYGFIIAIQLVLNLTAVIYFYKFLCRFYQSDRLALIATLLFIGCFPFQTYNSYLYTESIFFSLVIIFSCLLFAERKYDFKNITVLFLLLLVIMFTRPTAIFVLGATGVYLYFFFSKKFSAFWRICIFLSLTTGTLLLLNFLLVKGSSKVAGDFGIDILEPFRYEHIICGVPTVDKEAELMTLPDSNSINGLVYYIIHNASQFSRLALLKTKAFFGLQRSYYSALHNIFLAVYFYPIYLLMVLALFRFVKKIPSPFIFIISLIIIMWICVVSSCDEWHSRFFMMLTPFWIMGALYFFKPNKSLEI